MPTLRKPQRVGSPPGTHRAQLLTLMVTGSASLKVSGVSGRSLMSFFPVTRATVVPAAAPTGPPMSAPSPPPTTAPIRAPPPAPPPIHAQLRFLWLPPTLGEAVVRMSYVCPFTA